MELKTKSRYRNQRGTSLIELMIASVVLIVGVLGTAVLIPIAIGTNSKNKQQSNSTVVAQMTMEKITSASSVGVTSVTLTDCGGTAHTINVAGSTTGAGAALLSSGAVDFSSAAPAGYAMSYTVCGTLNRQSTYDVRWNVKNPSSYVKIVTISAKLQATGTSPILFSLPVTIRSLVGGN